MSDSANRMIFGTALLVCLLSLGVHAQAQTPDGESPPGSTEVRVIGSDTGRTVSLSEQQMLVVELDGNPATGHVWEVEQIDGSVLRRWQDGSSHFVTRSDASGPWQQQVLRFKTTGTGRSTLRLVYHRPWLKDVPPLQTFSIQVEGIGEFTGANLVTMTPTPTATPTRQTEILDDDTASFMVSGQALPSAYDWCDHNGCTAVKDQGNCGSCWAFAAVGVFESVIKIKDGVSRNLSEQYLVSCNTDDWGCDGGLWAHDYHLNKIPPGESAAGSVYEADFPYVAADVACNAPHTHHEKIKSWDYVGSGYGVPAAADIKAAIYQYGPVAVGVCAGDAMSYYSGGIFSTDESSDCPYGTNHAVILVGWDDGNGVWIMRNSWGTSWGESGYMRITYGTSLIGDEANYVVYGSTTSPTATPVPTRTPTPFHVRGIVYLPVLLKNSAAIAPTPVPTS